MKRIFIFLAASLIMTACDYEFDPDIKSEPALFLKCAAYSDSALVQLEYAASVESKDSFPKLKDKLVEMKVDGTTVPVPEDGKVFRHFKSGETIEAKAGADGFKQVSGSAIIPDKPQVKSITVDYQHMFDTLSMTVFTLEMENEPGADDYFAVAIKEEASYRVGDSIYFRKQFVSAYIPSDSGDYTILSDNSDIMGSSFYNVSIFKSNVFKERKCKITMSPIPFPDNPSAEDLMLRHKFYVARLSDGMYHYSLARYKAERDFLATLGLAPAKFAWSNIKGGMGFCGASMVYESEYIYDSRIKNL